MHNQLNREPLIKVTDLSINSNQRTILKNINLQIFDKEIITIIGPNGAGKSTLIRAILGLIKISQGKVIRSPNLKIGYIPQKALFPEHIPINVITFLNLNNKHNFNQKNHLINQNTHLDHIINQFRLCPSKIKSINFYTGNRIIILKR